MRLESAALIAEVETLKPGITGLVNRLGDEPSLEACHLFALLSVGDYSQRGDAFAERAAAHADALGIAKEDRPRWLSDRERLRALDSIDLASARTQVVQAFADAERMHFDERTLHISAQQIASLAGDIDELLAVCERSTRYFRSRGLDGDASTAQVIRAHALWARGEHAAADALLEQLPPDDIARRLEAATRACVAGDLAEALRLCPDDDHPGTYMGVQLAQRVLLLHLAGRGSDATREFSRWREAYVAQQRNIGRLLILQHIDDALVALGDPELLADIAAFLNAASRARYYWDGTAIDRLRGAIALKLDRVDEAEQHFRTGLEWASRLDVRFEVDAGRCHQGLAEVAERRGQHAEAMAHLDAAGELFARHGAKLYLDQVIAKKQILKA
jgi:tetratricopeptide (TPR) repeat protein